MAESSSMWGAVSILLLLSNSPSAEEPLPASQGIVQALNTHERFSSTAAADTVEEAGARVQAGRGRVFRWMYQDLGSLAAKAVSPRTILYAAGTFGATLGLASLDDDIISAAEDIPEGPFRDALDVVDYLGGPVINAPVVLLAGASLLTNSPKLQDAAFTSLQTLLYAGLLGYALKGIVGRGRPESTDNSYAFFSTTGKNPFSHEGNSSFPAGHTISSFGIITPWVLYYPGPVTYSLYAFPVGTALSRVVRKKHWPTDLVVGAAIGVAMGSWLTRRHQAGPRDAQPVEIYMLEGDKLIGVRITID